MENNQQSPGPDAHGQKTVALNEHGLPAIIDDQPSTSDRVGIPTLLQFLLNLGRVIAILVILWIIYWSVFSLLSLSLEGLPIALAGFGAVSVIVLVDISLRRFIQKKYLKDIPESERETQRAGAKVAGLKSGRAACTLVLCLWLLSNVSASVQTASNPASVAGILPLITFPLALVSIVGIILTSILIKKAKGRQ